jgi:hypothetical protein
MMNYEFLKQNIMKKILALMMAAAMVFVCCNKDNKDNDSNDPENLAGDVDVYVVGRVWSQSVQPMLIYWKNGKAFSLTDGTREFSANAITVSGNDVYIAGYVVNDQGRAVATYWKNNQAFSLTYGSADDIAVSGSDVYVLSYKANDNRHTLWKNGQEYTHPGSLMVGLAASGSDVYVCGQVETGRSSVGGYLTTTNGCYWKNGHLHELSPDYLCWAQAIAISGSDVYITGSRLHAQPDSYETGYWRNGSWFCANKCSSMGIDRPYVYAGHLYSFSSSEPKHYWLDGAQLPVPNGMESRIDNLPTFFGGRWYEVRSNPLDNYHKYIFEDNHPMFKLAEQSTFFRPYHIYVIKKTDK